jgi:hypothetical protein
MVNEPQILNASILNRELDWFNRVLETRLKLHFDKDSEYASPLEIAPPAYENSGSFYERFLQYYELDIAERIVLILSLIPHIQPQLLDVFWMRNSTYERGFTEFGGAKGSSHGGFIPTGETALFILAGTNLEKRFEMMRIFESGHFFSRHHIVNLLHVPAGEPFLSGILNISNEFIEYFTHGNQNRPVFGTEFPARLITTPLAWEDLVLQGDVLDQIDEIKAWADYGDKLLRDWGLDKNIKPGYRALFHGPPGTGKTLTACLLGQYCQREVYCIDLSMVVSKYIGETEKNLNKVFETAENKSWILFFDEADALFGKRTRVSDAHDRYANQEVSYLLQRVEEFNGIVILASNLKANMDEAFTRRFQSVIYFPMPQTQERLRLWQNGFSKSSALEEKVSLTEIAGKYELSGGAIMNIIRYCSLMALRRNETIIRLHDLEQGIRKELLKEGKTL